MGVPLVVWQASLTLSNWLEAHTERLCSSMKALELGSGTGLLGIYTIKRLLQVHPEAQITLTDMEQSVNHFPI